MSTLFEYVKAIDEIIINNTDEDGVISDEALEELNTLELLKDEKVDNCISFYKSRKAIAEALKQEKANINKRQQTAENEAEWMKNYLASCLDGSKWESTAGQISYRKSETVEIDDVQLLSKEYVTEVTEIKPDKTAIKKAIKEGVGVLGAHLEEHINTMIK